MTRLIVALGVMLGLSGTLCAAPAKAAAPAFKSSFARPPAEAAQALKVTMGKPFTAGYVFVDGKYVKPPYKVERYGTVIRINGIQVTDQIVPWEEFVKTQSGVTATKSETPAAGGDPFDEPAAPEPEPEVEEEEEDDDDSASSLDDLFDDDPAPKKKSTVKKAKKRKPAAPRPRKPVETVSYSFEGAFVPNERTKAMVTKINAVRTGIDALLRGGGYYCFGSRYAALSGDGAAAKRVIPKLPDLMKGGKDRETFGSAMRQAGLSFFPIALNDDLFRNRFDYLLLSSRIKEEQEQSKWQNLLK